MRYVWSALVAIVCLGSVNAEVPDSVRVTPYDFRCLDKDGAQITPAGQTSGNFTRFDKMLLACIQDPRAAFWESGRYRFERASTPTCTTPRPADETQPGACPTGTTGSWTQTRTYASAPYPTCWSAGNWTPSAPPAGTCVTAPPPVSAAMLTYAVSAAGTYSRLDGTSVPAAINVRAENVTGPCVFWLDGQQRNIESSAPFAFPSDDTLSAFTPGEHTIEARCATNARASFTVAGTPPTPTPDPAPTPTGSASLSWQIPTTNTDGSRLTNLAGFRIVYGTSASNLSQTITVSSPTSTAYTVDSLAPATWYFAVRAYNATGAESAQSNVASKAIQ